MKKLEITDISLFLLSAFVFTGAFTFTAVYAAGYENRRLHFIASVFFMLSIILGLGALAVKNMDNPPLRRSLVAAITVNLSAQIATCARDLEQPMFLPDRLTEIICAALMVLASYTLAVSIYRTYKYEGSGALKIPANLMWAVCAYETFITVFRIIFFENYYVYMFLWIEYAFAYLLNMSWFFLYLFSRSFKAKSML